MNLKDWEIYKKTTNSSKSSSFLKKEDGPATPENTEEFRKVVSEIEKLPNEVVELATRILKQFLK